MKNIISIIILIIALGVTSLKAQNHSAFGIVFVDNNKNELFDKNDTPLSNVSVSSLDSIVKTNFKGEFIIPVNAKDIIFITKPIGFQSKLKENGVPQFYQLLYRKTPAEPFEFDVVEHTPIPDTIFFPLYKTSIKDFYSAHMIGDIQTPGKSEVESFQELIVPELFKSSTDFNVCLGDIADNNLNIYPEITKALKWLKTPTYMVFGNHDINFKAIDAESEAETYRKYFGPDYYSFNYGNTHFVVLNTVNYKGWNNKEQKNGSYSGGISNQQLNWLKQDIQLTPIQKRIVLMAHIPLIKGNSDSVSISQVFSLLEDRKNIVAIYGHLHANASWIYSPETQWFGDGVFNGHIAGAACGGWWVGPFDLDSIPSSTSNDGSPAGIYRYEFRDKEYTKQFIPGGKDPNFQLRISDPPSTISSDSLSANFVFVNVFDGDEKTVVEYSIDSKKWMLMEKVIEIDPYILRNKEQRINRDNWTPTPHPSSHLWKASYPGNISKGKHLIKANCTLSNGKKYSTIKIFEIL